MKQFASIADVVVVAVGFNPATEGEGHDRTFTLPWGQDALIEAVAAANPHTIVTLTGGGGMDTQPLARQGSRAAPHLVSRPGGRHGRRRGSLRQAQPRGQAARQLRPQLGKTILRTTEYYPITARTPRCTSPRTANRRRLRHSAREIRRQADGRLSLLDDHGQAPALPVRIRPQLHDVQLLQPRRRPRPPLPAQRFRSAST